jgi:transposase
VSKPKTKKKRGAKPRARPLKQSHAAKAWSEEARREAVALLESGDVPLGKLAEDLGVTTMTLRAWQRRFEAEDHKPLSIEERRELERLRRENQTLQMEREILKKAATFFARHRS